MKSTLSRLACVDGNFSCYTFAVSFYRLYVAPAQIIPCFKAYACRRHCVDDRLDSAVRVLYYPTNLVKYRRSVVCKALCSWQASGDFFPCYGDVVHLTDQSDCLDVVSEGRRAYLSSFCTCANRRIFTNTRSGSIFAPFGEGLGALFYQTLLPNKVKISFFLLF